MEYVVDGFVRQTGAGLRDEHRPFMPEAAPGEFGAERLAVLLLAGPGRLSSEVASCVVRAGLGRMLPRDCGLPPMPRHPLPLAYLRLVVAPLR
jgi:hypothetical protein